MDKPPKRYSHASFWVCLFFAVNFAMVGVSRLFADNIFSQEGWDQFLLVSVVLFAVSIYLHRRNKKADAACDALELQQIETQRMLHEKLRAEQAERQQRQTAWENEHGKITTKLVGVTFDNDDGTSRQRILKGAMADECCGSIELENYTHNGADAILVSYEGQGIGNIPKNRVAEVLAVMDRITGASLNVERFVPDDEDGEARSLGGVIYRADLTIVYTK